MKQKLFTFFFALVASISAIYAQSGTCGSNLTWMLDAETGVLTISGTGAMDNYYYGRVGTVVSPWNEFTSVIKTVIINDGVTSIGNQAFYECSSLTSVTIGESVTSIGNYAFCGCSSITSITIPNSVTSIGNNAFDGCFSLTSVTIGESVTSIGDFAFWYCFSLKYLTIGNSVTSIGNQAFDGCSSLTSVTIPNSVTSIGSFAFQNCSSLTSVTIPNSVTSIGNYAFCGCSSIASPVYNAHCFAYMPTSYSGAYTIPEGIEQIAGGAFAGCSSITSITIPNSVTSIGNNAFYGCSSLTSVTCEAETPPTVGQYAFDGVSKSIPVYVPCECVEAYKAASGWEDFTNIQELLAKYSIEVYVNDTIMGTAKVNYNTFCEGNQISATPNFGCYFVQWSDGNTENPRTLELTQDTTLTAEFAKFLSGQCGDSLYWELVDTTLHITGKGEMYDYKSDSAPWKLLVSSIKVLTIAEDVTKLSQSFDSCSVLESIVWNAKNCADVSSLETAPFYAIRSQITSFTFGENVEHIPAYLCDGMDKLTSMTIPNSVTSIGSSAFYNCSSLTSVILTALSEEEFCKGQGNSLLYSKGVRCQREIQINGTKVTKFTIPNGVTSIGNAAFYGCSSLTSVTIPNSVTSIGDDAFYGCESLNKTNYTGDIAGWCNIMFGDSYANPMYYSRNFYINDQEIKDLVIPNSVTSIGDYAFCGCSSLTSVTIGESVTSIGKSAFEGCSAIDSIVWNAKNCADASSLETAPFYAIRSQITSFTFGENVEHIPAYLCDGMEKLTSVTIPNSVKTIGTSAFEGCARLGKISLGTGLEEIAANAFAGCTRLYDIYCHAVYPPFVDESSFANYNAYLYIPCDSKRDYTLDPIWGKFQHIECLSDEETDVENVETSSQQQTNCQKLLRNGQLLILRDGKTYNAMGQEL